jgi:hypothetical protein
MHQVETRLDRLERGNALSGQVSVGSLRIGGLLIQASTDANGYATLVLSRDTSGSPSSVIATLTPD